MQLTLWTYEGPTHVGAMRIATAMRGLHYVLHAPQGDTYADLLFTMIVRRDRRPPVTYTTFQARDLELPVERPQPVAAQPESPAPIEPPAAPALTGEGTPLSQAQAAIAKGDLDGAVSIYTQLIDQGQNLDATIHDLRDALYRHPVDFSLWQTLGDAYIKNNQVQEALDAYTKAEEFLK